MLKFDHVSNLPFAAADVGYLLTNTVAGTTYRISFEVSGCGGTNDLWYVLVNNVIINSIVAQGDCNTWAPFSGTFIGTGNDLIDVRVNSPFLGTPSQWYFDNFVVVEV